jgi:DNA primase
MDRDRQPGSSGRRGTGSSSLGSGEGELAAARLPTSQHGIDFKALREMVSIRQVLELVGWVPVARNGPQARGPCPIHKSSRERSRSFSVNLEKNLFQCFGCGEKGNQLDLWMAVTGLSVYDAARDLADRLHLDTQLISKWTTP